MSLLGLQSIEQARQLYLFIGVSSIIILFKTQKEFYDTKPVYYRFGAVVWCLLLSPLALCYVLLLAGASPYGTMFRNMSNSKNETLRILSKYAKETALLIMFVVLYGVVAGFCYIFTPELMYLMKYSVVFTVLFITTWLMFYWYVSNVSKKYK